MDSTPLPFPITPTPDIRVSVEQTIDAMHWLTPTDAALKALALALADEIQGTVDRAREYDLLFSETKDDVTLHARVRRLEKQCNVTKTVGWLGPQLKSVLNDLGGTPGTRKDLGETSKASKRLAELREAADVAIRKHDS